MNEMPTNKKKKIALALGAAAIFIAVPLLAAVFSPFNAGAQTGRTPTSGPAASKPAESAAADLNALRRQQDPEAAAQLARLRRTLTDLKTDGQDNQILPPETAVQTIAAKTTFVGRLLAAAAKTVGNLTGNIASLNTAANGSSGVSGSNGAGDNSVGGGNAAAGETGGSSNNVNSSSSGTTTGVLTTNAALPATATESIAAGKAMNSFWQLAWQMAWPAIRQAASRLWDALVTAWNNLQKTAAVNSGPELNAANVNATTPAATN